MSGLLLLFGRGFHAYESLRHSHQKSVHTRAHSTHTLICNFPKFIEAEIDYWMEFKC